MRTSLPSVLRLAAAQALLLTNGVTLIAINGLAGKALAPEPWLATVPVTAYVVGAALSTLPASFFMRRHGRRAGFVLGAGFGVVGALLGAWSVLQASFWLLCLATLLSGVYNAFGQYYRFAAADVATPAFRARAISWVLAGGIAGGVLGPAAARWSRDLLPAAYAASYLVLAVFAVLAALLALGLKVPAAVAGEQGEGGRPLREIARQPVFRVAVLAAAIGYGVMNLLMAATPLAMDICGLPFADAAFVLQWHVIGMFAPSFFTGSLIRRLGVLKVLLLGGGLMLVCTGIALSGVTLMHFWWALLLLGVGWNFLFIGGTTLLTEVYRPEEKAKVQGVNDFLVFAVQMASSFFSGVVITGPGWALLNQLAVPLIATTLVATGALWWRQRRGSV